MLDQTTKRKIDSARNILVGKVPDPKAQVEQITTALVYKFMDDMDKESEELGGKARFFTDGFGQYSWTKILDNKLSGQERLDLYVQAITNMSKNPHIPQLFRDIFKGAFLPYQDPRTLSLFLKEINEFNYDHSENLGNAFEYLLSCLSSQGDAGMFRTPRHIIDFIAEVVDPKKNESILDPACGTAGFLISAYKHILKAHDGLDNKTGKPTNKEKNLTPDEKTKLMNNIVGYDISPDMVKLSLVNMYLHGFQNPQIHEYDSLTSEKRWDETFDVIMANPPFMTPKGGIVPHKKFSIQANRAEVLFVDYIIEHLTIKGRAGIIVPEGIIFKGDKAYKALRKKLVEDGLFAVVSLPAGVFQPYSGVKTSILFFDNQVAKRKNEILFIKVENDGFDLGAQRREIEENDLPRAIEILKKLKQVANGEKKYLTYGDIRGIAHTVHKDDIAESGDYNLTGDKYKTDIYIGLQKITQDIEKTFEPFKETIKQIEKQTESHRKLTEQLQKQAEQINRVFASSMFQEAQKSMQQVAKQMQKAFKNVDFQEIIKQQKRLQKELKKQQKWKMVELGEVVDVLDKKRKPIRKEDRKSGEYPYYGATGILDYIDDYIFDEKLVLIGEDGAKWCSGDKTAFIAKGKYWVNNHAHVLRPKQEELLDDFLVPIINNMDLTIYITGATVPKLNQEKLRSIKIPLPPIKVQKEIVEQIEVKQNAINHAKEIIKNLERERRYFGQELRKLEDVEIVELGDVVKTTSGGTPLKSKNEYYENGTISWLTSGEVNQRLVHNSKQKITELGLKNSSAKMFPKNTVLVAMYGATAGKVGLLKFESSTNQAICGILPNDKFIPEFLYKYLETQTDRMVKLSGGGAQPNISQTIIKGLKIPLPPLAVQNQLVAEAEKEEEIITANKKLIEIMERKIEKVIEEI